jgi:hypothetical protein
MPLFATIVLSLPRSRCRRSANILLGPRRPARRYLISYSYGLSSRGDVIAGEASRPDRASTARACAGAGPRRRVGDDRDRIPSSDALNTPAASALANGRWIVGRAGFTRRPRPRSTRTRTDGAPRRWLRATRLPVGFAVAAALDANVSGNVIVGYGIWTPRARAVRARLDEGGTGFDVGYLGRRTAPRRSASIPTADRDRMGRLSGSRRRGGRGQRRVGSARGGALASRPERHGRADVARGLARDRVQSQARPVRDPLEDVRRQHERRFHLGELGRVDGRRGAGDRDPATLPGFSSGAPPPYRRRAARIVRTCWTPDFEFETCLWISTRRPTPHVVSSLKARLAANGVASADGWTLVGGRDQRRRLDPVRIGDDPLFRDQAWAGF